MQCTCVVQVKALRPELPPLIHGSYLGVHLRVEDDWRVYCQNEAQVWGPGTPIGMHDYCIVTGCTAWVCMGRVCVYGVTVHAVTTR